MGQNGSKMVGGWSRGGWLLSVLVVLVLVQVGCGNGEERWSDECVTDEDCSGEQPHCKGGECYPCLEDEHCEGERVCVHPDPVEHNLHYWYCNGCRTGECPEGQKCSTRTCYRDTYECTETGKDSCY